MKTRLITLISVLFLTVSFVQAQESVSVVGSGKTGTITPEQIVTGEILVSEDGRDIQPISFVGHNGGNRVQGDFDAWSFDAAAGENCTAPRKLDTKTVSLRRGQVFECRTCPKAHPLQRA